VLVVVRYGKGLDAGRYIGKTHIADGSARLADGLYDGSGGGHGKAAAHVILIFQYAFFKEFVCAGRGLTRVDHYFAVVSAYLLPIGDFTAEDIFQLSAGELLYGIGRVYDNGQRIIGYRYFSGCFRFHLLAEFDASGSHCDVGRFIQQGGNAYPASASGDGDAGIGIQCHKAFGGLLCDGQNGVAAFDALRLNVGSGKCQCEDGQK